MAAVLKGLRTKYKRLNSLSTRCKTLGASTHFKQFPPVKFPLQFLRFAGEFSIAKGTKIIPGFLIKNTAFPVQKKILKEMMNLEHYFLNL